MLKLRSYCFRQIFNKNIRFISSKPREDIFNALNDEIQRGETIPVYKLAAIYNDKVAVQDGYGDITYKNLFDAAKSLSNIITDKLRANTQKTITYLCPCDSSNIVTQWAIWMSGNIAVPLSPQYPPASLEYFMKDCGSSATICDINYLKNLPNQDSVIHFPKQIINNEDLTQDIDSSLCLSDFPNGEFYSNSDAMILYTSGTTSKPKGVVYGFKQISAQIVSLHSAWNYRYGDIFLHALPLHHVHGQINSVSASLSAGATLRMLTHFDAATVWTNLLGMNKKAHGTVSVFMGVPTMYSKLIEEYKKILSKNHRQIEYIRNYMKHNIRLMVSGSAPLPTPIYEHWYDITSHRLLERYGMTEIGMALSNVYEPMSDRTPGFVGYTLPGVSAQIIGNDTSKGTVTLATLETPPWSPELDFQKYYLQMQSQVNANNLFKDCGYMNIEKKCKVTYHQKQSKTPVSGELLVRGPGVFKQYWNRPEQTKAEFTTDGWFKTGDTAILENGQVRIQGRTSIDIIKSGGYKISALDIETVLLGHESIVDIAVLGLPDITWGETVSAVIEFKSGSSISLKELQKWALQYLPKYQLPTKLFPVDKITRNAMGKVNKKELKDILLKKPC